MPAPRNYALAAFLALSAFFCWTVSDVFLKMARAANVPQGEIIFLSGISGMAAIFVLTVMRGKISHLQPHGWKGLSTIGLCQLIGFFLWLVAAQRLPLTSMYVVSFITPMMVACLAALILKEALGLRRAVAISVGFAGVVISVNPANLVQNSANWLPYMAMFGNMLCSAIQMFLLRVVAEKEKSECTSFYPRSVLVIAGAMMCATTGFVELKPWIFAALCAQGALGGLGWALVAKAYKCAPAAAVAPFQYSQLIFGAVAGYLIWNDVPSAYLVAGAAVIISSGIYLVRHERRISRTMSRAE